MKLLQKTIDAIEEMELDPGGRIRARLDEMAIPRGSLGRLEELALIYSSIVRTTTPKLEKKVIFTFAGDHGVVEENVSVFPKQVTQEMVANFLAGGAAINVLGRHAGARVIVIDCGVDADLSHHSGLRVKKVGRGTGNIAKGPAMSREDAVRAMEVGIEAVEEELPNGIDIIGIGDMGIGNTTPSSAILAAFTGLPAREVTGAGTGVKGEALKHKIEVIDKALKINSPDPHDPIDVLAKVGGFEIGGLAGVCLASARHRIPVIVDGFISTAGALVACELEPKVSGYVIASHCSMEQAHSRMLERLGKRPLLDLNMRLGEGTGAALAMNLVEAGVKIMTQTATFAQASVTEGEGNKPSS